MHISANEEHYYFEVKADITEWLPGGRKIDAEIKLPESMKAGCYSLLAGITDGKTQVLFATDAPRVDGFTVLANDIVLG